MICWYREIFFLNISTVLPALYKNTKSIWIWRTMSQNALPQTKKMSQIVGLKIREHEALARFSYVTEHGAEEKIISSRAKLHFLLLSRQKNGTRQTPFWHICGFQLWEQGSISHSTHGCQKQQNEVWACLLKKQLRYVALCNSENDKQVVV